MLAKLMAAGVLAAVLAAPIVTVPGSAAQDATPAAATSCEDVQATEPVLATPNGHTGHDQEPSVVGAPATAMDQMAMDIDLVYIDMMIPHHDSIIAMAEAALPRLTDERLREIARAVIATQQPEIDELRGYREAYFGDPEPMPMDQTMMAAMDRMMPGMAGTMDEMAFQMDAAAQVAAICAADNADLAFIDLTIPHHQMAIDASEALLEQSERPELRALAERVIAAQQAEIETQSAIRAELTSAATPAAP